MVKTKAPPRRKHVPIRTCIVCRQSRGKRDLVRIVRSPEGVVQVDPSGKAAGRGAYLCRAGVCWRGALTGGRLSAALKTSVAAEDLSRLAAFAATLPETLSADPVEGAAKA